MTSVRCSCQVRVKIAVKSDPAAMPGGLKSCPTNFGCGGSQPSIPTSLYVVAA